MAPISKTQLHSSLLSSSSVDVQRLLCIIYVLIILIFVLIHKQTVRETLKEGECQHTFGGQIPARTYILRSTSK